MVRKMLPIALAAFVAGCSGGDSDSEVAECETTITPYPASAAQNVYYRTTVEAAFLPAADNSATITVDGVNGTTEWRGNTLVFTPSAPLAPDTEYTATVTHACAPDGAPWTFKTGEVGAAVDTAGLAGKAYSLDLASGRFVHPEGVGSLLQTYLTTDVLVGVVSADASSIQMVGAIGVEDADPPAQDTCNATIPFPSADFSANPFFVVGPEQTTITVEDYEITIDELMISGAFAPDASYITGAVLSGSIDTRPLVPLLGDEGADENAICDLASSIGVSCEACADGTGNFCLSIYVDNIQAAAIPTALETIPTQEDACLRTECAADPDCTPDTAD
jgi:hypothetical protein